MKTCRDCSRSEPEIKFYATRRTNVCSECENTKRKARGTNQHVTLMDVPSRTRYYRNNRLKYRYGITLDDYLEMLESQNGVCAACGREPNPDRWLCVDHDHVTGKNRGLLCDLCNRTLGHAGDDARILRGLLSYLEHYQT